MSNQQAWKIDSVEWSESCRGAHVQLHGVEGLHYFTAGELAAAGITPPPDPINFDTMPVGTEVRSERTRWNCVKGTDGNWYGPNARNGCGALDPSHGPYTVVHVPDAPSVRTALHTIGLTDNDITDAVDADRELSTAWLAMKLREAAREAEQGR